MGHVFTQIKIIHPTDSAHFTETLAMVDTGSSFTIVTEKLARQVGVEPYRWQALVTASSQRVEWAIIHIKLELTGEIIYEDMAVKPGDEPILVLNGREVIALVGVQSLEALGLWVDPNTGRLIRGPALALVEWSLLSQTT